MFRFPLPSPQLFRKCAALFLLAIAPLGAVVGDLRTWMEPGSATDLLGVDDEVWVASTRGIYAYRGSTSELRKRYTPTDGLVGASVASLAMGGGEPVAIASTGEITRYSPREDRFVAVNSSWAAAGFRPTPGVVASRERYLLFGSDRRIGVFDLSENRTALTLEHLSGGMVRQILTDEKSVRVLFDSALWEAPFRWDSLQATRDSSGQWINHADPSHWIQKSVSGTLPFRAVAQQSDGSWKGTSSVALTRKIGGETYSASSREFCRGTGTKQTCVSLPGDDVAGLTLLALGSDGTVWGWGEPWFWRQDGDDWSRVFSYNKGLASTVHSVTERWARPVVLSRTGEWFIGSWGKGAMQMGSDGTGEKWLVPGGTGCPEPYSTINDVTQPYYTIVPAVAEWGAGMLFAWWKPESGATYGLGWWDGTKTVCRAVSGINEPYSLISDPSAEGSFWMTHAVGIQKLQVSPSLASVTLEQEYPSGWLGSISGVATDLLGRTWASGIGGVGVICNDQSPTGICLAGMSDTLVRADRWLSLPEALYSVVRHDGHGHLWLGTWGGGLVRLDVRKEGVARAGVEQWTVREGLPSDEILDIAVDPVSGVVWVTTTAGVVRIESAGRDREQFGKANPPGVYPNPFYPERVEQVRFDRIPPSARLAVYSRSGRLIRSWSGEALDGGLVEWDGRDPSGRVVEPGVYNWVVSSPSGTWKGRLILVR